MRYHFIENESLQELWSLRQEFYQLYCRREKDLQNKKLKLFQRKDFTKWGYDLGTLEKHSKELLKNKEKAFKFMLPEETQKLDEMREELSFYTNQCLSEVRRVGRDNADVFKDHFATQAQL